MLEAKRIEQQDTSQRAVNKDHLETAYQQICSNYKDIDEFRSKLLALLPFATGAGIFLLLNKEVVTLPMKSFFLPVGLFGFAITLGLFVYEIYGIRKCHELIASGKRIEDLMYVDGAFTSRPRDLLGFINEPFAAGIIYSAVLSAWTFIGLVFAWSKHAWWIALVVFFVGLSLSLFYNFSLKSDKEVISLILLNQRILRAEEVGDKSSLDSILHADFSIVRASGEKQDRETFLNAVPANKNRGRSADKVEVRMFGIYAVFTCRITTTLDKDSKPVPGNFWNTRLFKKQGNDWQCVAWQVIEIPQT